MQLAMLSRVGARGLRRAGLTQRMGVATLASFKTPKVVNEPNVSPAVAGSQTRS